MYKYKKRPSKLRKIITLTILIIIVAATSIFIYDMYMNIDVYSHDQLSQNEGATRVSYIEAEEDTNKDITQILENTIKCVVGISKIKNTGNSIFLNDSASDLGLGTGMIISENGYILTNWHVAGDRYSNCYVTLENGKGFRFSNSKNIRFWFKVYYIRRFR